MSAGVTLLAAASATIGAVTLIRTLRDRLAEGERRAARARAREAERLAARKRGPVLDLDLDEATGAYGVRD